MTAYIPYPAWITPEIIPGFPVRWYGLMYVLAFLTTYLVLAYQVRKAPEKGLTTDDIVSLLLWCIIGLLIGARIVATTVYDPSHYYITHPWMIFWPFRDGKFTGLGGMSYHGGAIGAAVGGLLFARKYKRSFLELADMVILGVPLGYTFGRLGNFFNAELWGRVTTKSWGMVFPYAEPFSTRLAWVRETCEEIGMPYQEGSLVNLPRHPSQLYEAFFEGIVLWLVLWFIFRKRKRFHGQLLGIYLIGYGLVRFVIEYFRQPDSYMGFALAWGAEQEPTALFLSPLNFSMGQLLCLLMVIAGTLMILLLQRRSRIGGGR